MPRVTGYKALYPWSGGLNTSVDPVILDPNNLIQADNVVFTYSGSRRKRGGQARYNSYAVVVSSATQNFVYLADYWSNVTNAKREFFVAVSDAGKVFRSPFNGTWTQMTVSGTLSITQGGITSTVINEDLVIGFQGSNGVPKVWDNQNTSAALVAMTSTSGSLPFTNAWIVVNFLDRLFVSGDPANPDRVYVSRVGDYQRWTASSVAGTAITIDVGIGDGDPSGITAMVTGTGQDRSLYVCKRRHIYKIDCSDLNQTNWSITPISNQIGCIGQNTVAIIDMEDVIFASDRGIHTLNQVIKQTQIVEGEFLSAPIQYDYNNIISSGNKAAMTGIYVPSLNSYLLSCKRTGQTTYETVYGYNVETQQWFRWTSVPCNYLMVRFNKTTGLDEIYAADRGYVNKLQQTTLTDFGNPIVVTLKTPFIAPQGIPFTQNQFTNLGLIYRARDNSSIRVYYSVDGLTTKSVNFPQKFSGGNTLGTTVLGPSFLLGSIQAIRPVWNHLGIDEGASLQLTIIQDGANQDLEIFGAVIEYEADEEAQNAFINPIFNGST